MVENVHNYGGRWTEEKLDRVSAYLKAYLNVLKNQEFTRFYIDAFAGTPYYEPGEARKAADYADNLPGMQEPESVGLRRGSVKRALDIEPGFDRHIFIEKNARFAEELSMLRDQFQQKDISIRRGDCNAEIERLCEDDWKQKRYRGVLFLDPYGMQVEWRTIKTIAQTEAIDMWLLLPLGAVNRLLPRSYAPPEPWAKRLTTFFGTDEWRNAFYMEDEQTDLFESDPSFKKRTTVTGISRYFVERLQTIFGNGLAKEPLVLTNTRGIPLYLLCFACSNPNPKARAIALQIAEHILKDKP